MHYVYLLRCSDDSIYTGCTTNVDERLKRHQAGYIEYTRKHLPVELVFYAAFPNQAKAYAFEKYLKSGSGFAFRNKHLI
ncbi:MAG: GIY-YIG nuclease family protein [Cyclobacteriaceae bacterium]